MVLSLLIGLPGERPGGLVLSLLYFLAAGTGGLIGGFGYAALCTALPRMSLPLQAGGALLRGVPLLLLVFLAAHLPGLSTTGAGLLALLLYSVMHVGEILRAFLTAYPSCLADQACVIGINRLWEWLDVRLPWTLWRAWTALLTHWVSLVKDTGALVVLGIGELTTVAKVLSELQRGTGQWAAVLGMAAVLYLAATLVLIRFLPLLMARCLPVLPGEDVA